MVSREHAQAASQRVGDAWLAEERSLALRGPSVLNSYGATYLLNPGHPRFAEAVQTSEGASYPFDERLVEWEEA
jgi:RES domain-containing protein